MLAISTVTKKAYIAVSCDGKEYFSEIDSDCKQSENILCEIDKILDKNGLGLKDVGDIAVVVGPGSFTGIRIGVALVKGLCAGDKSHKVIPISTLDLMAKAHLCSDPQNDYACVMNALSGRFFVSTYDKNGKKLTEEKMIYQEDLSLLGCDLVVMEEEIDVLPGVSITSKLLLDYAQELKKSGVGIAADKICPVYIRKAQAEENIE